MRDARIQHPLFRLRYETERRILPPLRPGNPYPSEKAREVGVTLRDWVLLLLEKYSVVFKYCAERGDGTHENGDAAFDVLPEGFPDEVEVARGRDRGLHGSEEANKGHNDHDDGEAAEDADTEFLSAF